LEISQQPKLAASVVKSVYEVFFLITDSPLFYALIHPDLKSTTNNFNYHVIPSEKK
jgi:hypothetical protein